MQTKTYEQIVKEFFTGDVNIKECQKYTSLDQYLDYVMNESNTFSESERLALIKLLIQDGATQYKMAQRNI